MEVRRVLKMMDDCMWNGAHLLWFSWMRIGVDLKKGGIEISSSSSFPFPSFHEWQGLVLYTVVCVTVTLPNFRSSTYMNPEYIFSISHIYVRTFRNPLMLRPILKAQHYRIQRLGNLSHSRILDCRLRRWPKASKWRVNLSECKYCMCLLQCFAQP